MNRRQVLEASLVAPIALAAGASIAQESVGKSPVGFRIETDSLAMCRCRPTNFGALRRSARWSISASVRTSYLGKCARPEVKNQQ